MKKIYLSMGALALSAASFCQTKAPNPVAIFDAVPGGTYFLGSTAGGHPNAQCNQLEEDFGLNYSQTITGFDCDINVGDGAAGATTHQSLPYTDLQVVVDFWPGSECRTSWSGSGSEMTTTASYQVTYDFGAVTLEEGYYYSLGSGNPSSPEFTMPTPFKAGQNNFGFQATWLVNSGSGLVPATTIQNGFDYNAAATVGYNAFAKTSYNMTWQIYGGTAATAATGVAQGNYIYTGATLMNLAYEFYGKVNPIHHAGLLCGGAQQAIGGVTVHDVPSSVRFFTGQLPYGGRLNLHPKIISVTYPSNSSPLL